MGEMQRLATDDYMGEVREPAGFARADADIAGELRERLADDVGLDAVGIEIEVKDGEVTLRGVVRQCADAKRAETHACSIPGVAVVRNELRDKTLPSRAVADGPVGTAAKMGKPLYDR